MMCTETIKGKMFVAVQNGHERMNEPYNILIEFKIEFKRRGNMLKKKTKLFLAIILLLSFIVQMTPSAVFANDNEGTDGADEADEVTVTITEKSGIETYDGTVKTVTGYDVSIDNNSYTVNDFTFNGTASVSGTNAGTYSMELKPEDFTNINDNFNVKFEIEDGTLEITKRQVILTSATDYKDFNGEPLTNDTITVSGDGWAKDEGATYDVTGSQTEIGESNNTFTYTLDENTATDNYDITMVEGTLTVTSVTDPANEPTSDDSKNNQGLAPSTLPEVEEKQDEGKPRIKKFNQMTKTGA